MCQWERGLFMKGIMRRFVILVLSLAVICSIGVVANAATSSSDYSVKVSNKSISFIRGGKTVGTHASRDGNVTIVTAPSGALGLCYYTTDNRYVRVALGSQSSLDITGTIPTLTVDKSLNSGVKLTLGSDSSVTSLKVNAKNKVTIGGKVTTLTISSGATVNVASGGAVTTAKVSSSMATLTAASGSSVSKVTSVSGASVSGKGIKNSSSTSKNSSSDTGKTTKNVTLTADYGDTLGDLYQDLNKKVKIYDSDGYRVIGTAEWDNSDKTEVRDGRTYDYTFYPNSAKNDEVTGTATINVSGDSSSSKENSRTLRLDVATIFYKSTSAKLRDLEDYLDEAVVAYDSYDSQVSGRAEWISDTSTGVRSGQSYSFIFVPNDSTYDSARGTVKIELGSKSSGVGGGEITLASFTIEADYRDYLDDLRSQLQDNVRAYNSSGSRISGTAKWLSSNTRLTVTGTYRYEFVPDNSRYETANGDIKVFVSGSGTSGSNSNKTNNSSSSKRTLTLDVDTITSNGTNNSLRDLTSELADAVTARNSSGSRVYGTVKWVDSNTSQKVRSTNDYRFKFIPDDSSYDEKQEWVTIKVR